MTKFEVVLSGDFLTPEGQPAYPEFDLAPLRNRPDIRLRYAENRPVIRPVDLQRADALVLSAPGIDAESFSPDSRLALIARFGVGYENIDVEACTRNGVALVITAEGVRRPVAVSILTLILALTGRLFEKDRLCRAGPAGWARVSEHHGLGLVGRVLGSIGFGNIGAEMFRIAKPLGMKGIAHDPYADPRVALDIGVKLAGLEEVVAQSDVLTVNCPLTPATFHLLNGDRLALMKPTAFLINTARGGIVDQAALTEALRNGRIAGAGLDVFEKEPPDPDDPILSLDNVVLTPHALCWTDQLFAGCAAVDTRAVLDVLSGREPRGLVNREVVAHPGWRAKLQRLRSREDA